MFLNIIEDKMKEIKSYTPFILKKDIKQEHSDPITTPYLIEDPNTFLNEFHLYSIEWDHEILDALLTINFMT